MDDPQMQDHSGDFPYRRYLPWLINKIRMLHWGRRGCSVLLLDSTGVYRKD